MKNIENTQFHIYPFPLGVVPPLKTATLRRRRGMCPPYLSLTPAKLPQPINGIRGFHVGPRGSRHYGHPVKCRTMVRVDFKCGGTRGAVLKRNVAFPDELSQPFRIELHTTFCR